MQEKEFTNDADNILVFNVEFAEEKTEFGCEISIYRTPEINSQERAIFIGRQLAGMLQIRVLVPYTSPTEPDNPYLNLIFENNKTYLADDSDTNFADGTIGKVAICGEHFVPSYTLDERANLLV